MSLWYFLTVFKFHKLAQMVKELNQLLKSDSHLRKKFELFA